MMRGQVRRVLRNCGVIDPGNVEHSLARGGYSGLERALGLERDALLAELERAGLRGRGGAGFPVWRKWKLCSEAPGEEGVSLLDRVGEGAGLWIESAAGPPRPVPPHERSERVARQLWPFRPLPVGPTKTALSLAGCIAPPTRA